MADFRRFRALDRLMPSYRTLPGARSSDLGEAAPAPIAAGGVRPPRAARAVHHGRSAGATRSGENFAGEAAEATPQAAREPSDRFQVAKQAWGDPGSGVQGTLGVRLLAREMRERARLGWKNVGLVRGDHQSPDLAEATTLGAGRG
jgi:hypothetical protein